MKKRKRSKKPQKYKNKSLRKKRQSSPQRKFYQKMK